MNCTLIDETLSEYVSVSTSPSNIKLKSKETKTQGKVAIKLIKAFESGSKDVGLVCRISATATAKEELKANYLSTRSEEHYWPWEYYRKIKTITFESKMRDMSTETVSYTYDVSRDQDKSIMAYLIPSESDSTLYDAYIQADGKIMAPEDSSSLFGGLYNLDAINNIEILDTSIVTNMYDMFIRCENLETLRLGNFDASSAITMEQMFFYCGIEAFDFSGFDTSNVTNMDSMFSYCKNLKEVDLSSFDTSNVTDIRGIFYYCDSLEKVNLSNFDLSNLTKEAYMFHFSDNNNRYPENLKITTNAATKEIILADSYNSYYINESNFIIV